jgi:drug/metabolite transporter (DMT)-like permease
MSLIWGIPYLFIRIAVDEISPATLVFARTAIAAVILLPIALTRTDYRAALGGGLRRGRNRDPLGNAGFGGAAHQ